MNKLALIDEQDQLIGGLDKYQTHQHPAQLHRAISIWLVNEQDQVLLQQRSNKKIVGGGWWANAVCGNVRIDESYSACAKRRLREELGIEVLEDSLFTLYSFRYQAYGNEKYGENELDQVFLLKLNSNNLKLKLNPNEVSRVVWIDKAKLLEAVKQKQFLVTAKQTMSMSLVELKEKTKPLKIELVNRLGLLAPWSWLMLLDKRLKL